MAIGDEEECLRERLERGSTALTDYERQPELSTNPLGRQMSS